MKKDMLKKILQLTLKDKESGIFIDRINQKIIIGIQNMPKNFTGEFKIWHKNGQLYVHCFIKNEKIHGEYKVWNRNENLWEHCFYEHGIKVKDFLK